MTNIWFYPLTKFLATAVSKRRQEMLKYPSGTANKFEVYYNCGDKRCGVSGTYL